MLLDVVVFDDRTDKREDRVEVGYKQLAEAADIAEVGTGCWCRLFFAHASLASWPVSLLRRPVSPLAPPTRACFLRYDVTPFPCGFGVGVGHTQTLYLRPRGVVRLFRLMTKNYSTKYFVDGYPGLSRLP